MDSSRETRVVRTRFAPSPTGYLHVGGVRTALFAWLLARQNNGEFVLRLEDTDKTREVEGADEHLINSLKTLGLNYDEGPDIGGQFPPQPVGPKVLFRRPLPPHLAPVADAPRSPRR